MDSYHLLTTSGVRGGGYSDNIGGSLVIFKLQFLFIFLLLVQIFHYCLKNRNCI